MLKTICMYMLIDTCHSCDPFLYSTGLWVPNIPHGFSGIEHAVVRYRCIFLSCKVTWLDILLSSSTSGLPVSPIFFLPFLWSSSLLLSLLLFYPLLSLSFPSPSITPPFPPPFFLFFLSLSLCSNPPCPLLPFCLLPLFPLKGYESVSINPEDFEDKVVLILGRGLSITSNHIQCANS